MTAICQPAFEVTNVESMQWNRTASFNPDVESATQAAAPLPADVIARIREAVKAETAHSQE